MVGSWTLSLEHRHSLLYHFRFPVVFFTAFVATSQSRFSPPFSCRLFYCLSQRQSPFSLPLSYRHFHCVCHSVSLVSPVPVVFSLFVATSQSHFSLPFCCRLFHWVCRLSSTDASLPLSSCVSLSVGPSVSLTLCFCPCHISVSVTLIIRASETLSQSCAGGQRQDSREH